MKAKREILNFCSPVFKKLKRQFEHRNRKGYLSLIGKIRESSQMVSYIKTGKSLFESSEIKEYHIPIFKEAALRKSLEQLINKS